MTPAATPPGTSLARPPVLVLRALGLGDALTAVPALRGLRRAFPGRRLLLAAGGEPADLLRSCGVVDAVVPTRGLGGPPPGAGLGPHIAVNLHGRGPQSHRLLAAAGPRRVIAYGCPEAGVDGLRWNEAEHEVRRWTRLVDAAAVRRGMPAPCRPEDLRLHVPGALQNGLSGSGRQPYAVLHPGASSAARRWPARRWARLAAALERRGVPVVLTGGPDERALVAGVAASAGLPASRCTAGELPLGGLTQLVAGAALLVCGDTGVAHLGTALATPSVLLFGPVPPSRWGPLADPELHTVLWHGDALGEGDPHADRCDPALLRITVDEVLAAATDRLERISLGTATA
ncbi:MAG TPA: glycosyltransferase family 9 protein [Kineosporiaceae bacterium]|nr:glycosyltransferase family 9 protein [Kineosporiaceae bacterium]